MKTIRGSISANQRQRHKALAELGHFVYVVKCSTPLEAQNQAEAIVLHHDIE